jgi:hypothetical protein
MAPPKLRKCTNPGDLWLSPNVEHAVPDEVCLGDRQATTVPRVSLVLARAQTLVRLVPVLVVLLLAGVAPAAQFTTLCDAALETAAQGHTSA